MDEFWLPISRFDYSSSAKDGCQELWNMFLDWNCSMTFFRTMPTLSMGGPDPAVFPNNSNFRSHYKEFVVHGCRSSYEAIQCKFPLADSNRVLLDWSTGFVDGMTKIMLCLCIIGFCEELEFTDEQLRDPDLRRTLDSFGAFRCSYQHFDNQGHHFLNAISFPALLQVVALFLSDWVVAPSQACFCCLWLPLAMLRSRVRHFGEDRPDPNPVGGKCGPCNWLGEKGEPKAGVKGRPEPSVRCIQQDGVQQETPLGWEQESVGIQPVPGFNLGVYFGRLALWEVGMGSRAFGSAYCFLVWQTVQGSVQHQLCWMQSMPTTVPTSQKHQDF